MERGLQRRVLAREAPYVEYGGRGNRYLEHEEHDEQLRAKVEVVQPVNDDRCHERQSQVRLAPCRVALALGALGQPIKETHKHAV